VGLETWRAAVLQDGVELCGECGPALVCLDEMCWATNEGIASTGSRLNLSMKGIHPCAITAGSKGRSVMLLPISSCNITLQAPVSCAAGCAHLCLGLSADLLEHIRHQCAGPTKGAAGQEGRQWLWAGRLPEQQWWVHVLTGNIAWTGHMGLAVHATVR
jgi:hypothetical protein